MSIVDYYNRFPDVHPNIVLKTDLLRQGVAIAEQARQEFSRRDDILWRGFHLFSYDAGDTKVYKDKIPMGFHLSDGCCVQLRTNDKSPYVLDFRDGEFLVSENGEPLAKGRIKRYG
jgi:hypothetical protein